MCDSGIALFGPDTVERTGHRNVLVPVSGPHISHTLVILVLSPRSSGSVDARGLLGQTAGGVVGKTYLRKPSAGAVVSSHVSGVVVPGTASAVYRTELSSAEDPVALESASVRDDEAACTGCPTCWSHWQPLVPSRRR